jgi:hypothetical protein
MRHLSALLERFKRSLGKDTGNKDAVIAVVQESTGITLKPEEINISNFTLEITSTPPKKHEIRMREEKILSEVRTRTHQNISRIFYH